MLPSRLEGVRLKVTRAHEHLTVLHDGVQAFRDREPYGVSCNREANGTELVLHGSRRREPTPMLGASSSETVCSTGLYDSTTLLLSVGQL